MVTQILDQWCERTGRKLVIRNTPTDKPTLIRYSLFPTKSSPTAPSREPRWGNMYLHKFLRSEDFDLHDHPWPFISLLLKGAYRELLPQAQSRMRKAGSLHFFPAKWVHSVQLEPHQTCWTLVIRGRHERAWGYHTVQGWVPARDYLTKVKSSSIINVTQKPKTPTGPVIADQWKATPERILLIGDDGLICPHMADHLMDYHPTTDLIVLSHGSDAKRIQDSSRFQRQATKNKIRILPYSSASFSSLIASQTSIDTVIYLDAHTAQSKRAEQMIQRGSFGMLQALSVSEQLSTKRFALVSSGEVHGPLTHTRRPHHPNDRTNPYSLERATLVGAEALLQAWSQDHDGAFVTIRTPNPFGERMPLDRPIARFLSALMKNETVQLRNRLDEQGKVKLSSHQYLHARDTARAILHAAINGTSGRTYNLSGRELNDLELVERLASMTGLHPKIETATTRERLDGYRFAMEETLGKDLQWKAPHGFDVSIQNTIEWMLKPEHRAWLQNGS